MRKQILLGALTVFGLTLGTQAVAQQGQFKCGVPQQLKKLYAENPQMEADYEALLHQYQHTEFVNGKKRVIYTIPIVFHVVHQYGSENIKDAQIYDQMETLNEDFRMQNADITDVIPQFDTVAADAHIEFRLATIDPYGQCTNGIEHIYNHNSEAADDYSKINQWHRSKYLNVWIVGSIGEAGVAGYAYYPTAAQGTFFYADGIIILHDYIGSTNTPAGWTGSDFRSRALTHEIGHYLGLAHTWGSTNDPEVACGDDGIEDTPYTAGHDNCLNLYDMDCVDTIVENVQNFMEYSYCSRMYTKDQATFMENVLLQTTSSRNNLYRDSNLMATGTYTLPGAICAPIADFSSEFRTACVGDAIDFKDASWRAGVTSYLWTFPGGSPATSTLANPTVTYAQDGYHDVTLTVTNEVGSDTKTIPNMIYVSGNWSAYTGPTMQNFNSGNDFWLVQNPESNHAQFNRVTNKGKDLSPCYALINYKNVTGADAFTADWFYYNRLGGSKDYLISPSYDLSHTSNVTVTFDYAYGTKATTLEEITEKLVIWSSRDCGKTWNVRKTIDAEELVTAGYVGETNFSPTSNTQWKTGTFNYSANGSDSKTRFRFEFVASDKSSNFFIDNINISGTLGIADNADGITGISLSPNPVSTGSDIAVEINDASMDMVLQVVDVNGQVVSTTQVVASNGTQTVMIPMNVAKGCYFLQATKGSSRSTHRVIVF